MARKRPSSSRSRRGTRTVRRRPGAPPGTLFTEPGGARPVVRLVRYGAEALEEREIASAEDVPVDVDARFATTWLDVAGPPHEALLRGIAERFGFHPLAMEDVAHLDQRPKVESYPPFTFVVARAAVPGEHVSTEQISLFVRPGLVVSFQERSEDAFTAVRERIRGGRPRLRTGGAEYLAYALLDGAVDSFFPVVEHLHERLESLEERVLRVGVDDVLPAIHEVRADLLTVRRALWPQREMVSQLLREEGPFTGDVRVFLRDVHDHAVQIVDLVETYREMASGLMGTLLSQISNRMNEVMKVLTMISTVFIPLSFIAGVYGMNFDRETSRWNMPELGWAFGYPAVMAVMGVIALGLVAFFVRKGWFR